MSEPVNEEKLLRTIISGSDWQTVISEIVEIEKLDPWSIDMIKLTDAFVKYLHSMVKFDFKIPARFILIAAILLRMKVEMLIEKEEEEIRKSEEQLLVDLEKVPPLAVPSLRKPTRKVTLMELIGALNKAMEFQERKETSILRRHRTVEMLIEKEEDIEDQILHVMENIASLSGTDMVIKFSKLIPDWTRGKVIAVFLPLLYLANRSAVTLEQEEMYTDIIIRIKDITKARSEKSETVRG
ncbi:MAG: segregation/condensation protein A [Candidatus Aenigmatarchaeota archaeon]